MTVQNRYFVYIFSVFIGAISLLGCKSTGDGSTEKKVTAIFTLTSANGKAPLDITFDASGSRAQDGNIVRYDWSFGDGESGTDVKVEHSYTQTGVYTAGLTVTDGSGATDTMQQTITVASNQSPVAKFTATPTEGAAPLQVSLDASASSDPEGAIATYSWDFGDKQAGSGVTTSHTYTTAGSYTISLTVADDDGATNTTTIDVTTMSAYSVGGTVSAAANTAVDNDVNNPDVPYAPNDSPDTAQALSNPVTLGGFSSAVGTNVSGDRFENQGDQVDGYRVTLVKNQTIVLSISDYDSANPTKNDLDLYLYDSSDTNTPIASSAGTVAAESVTVPNDGTFDVVIVANAGISNYVLNIGQSIASTSANTLRLEQEFVPGEMIVRYKNNSVSTSGSYSIRSRAASMGLVAKSGGIGRSQLLAIGGASQRESTFSSLGISPRKGIAPGYGLAGTDLQLKEDTINVVKALRARADVASADLNYIRRPLKTANDTYYSSQWDYPLINLPQAWDITTGKPTTGDVIVAVVDTGVFLTHPDLEANILTTGYDFVKNKNVSNDGDGIDSNPDDPGDSATPGMSSFHGTHVAGTIAAVSDNSLGVAGVSWNAKIMPVRVLGIGGGTSYDVIQGIRYAAGLNNDSGKTPMQPANIINLSLGGGGYSQAEEGEFKAVRDAGVIIIAAAGNENTSVPSYPASYNSVVSVSAVDKNKVRAPYSNYGKYIDVAAPGGDTSTGYKNGILSTLVNNSSGTRVATYGYYQGTSMAAPHMAGVVALMKAVYPGLTPDILDTLIASGNITEDLANNGTTTRDDQYGYGLIDALKAVQQAYNLANNGAQLPPVLVVDPSNVDFAVTQDNVTLTATNAGGGALSITGVTDDAAWLTVTASSVAGNGQGTYTATVDRTGLVDALYTAKITFTTDIAGSVVVPVKMFVGSSANADAGYHYMLLVNQATGKTIHTVTATSTAGQYVYSFNSVVPGNYYIVAGTDLDNDTYICDPGEACGGYPTLGQLSAIQVIDSDITGIDFSTNFKVDVGAGVLSIKRSPVVNLGTMKLWNH